MKQTTKLNGNIVNERFVTEAEFSELLINMINLNVTMLHRVVNDTTGNTDYLCVKRESAHDEIITIFERL